MKICECPYTVSDIKDFLKLFCKSFNQIKINYLKVFTNCHVSWDTLYHRFKLSCIQHAFDPWHFIHVIAGVVINNINNPPPYLRHYLSIRIMLLNDFFRCIFSMKLFFLHVLILLILVPIFTKIYNSRFLFSPSELGKLNL